MPVRVVVRALGLLALVAAVAAYGAFGANVWRWGCPSQAERDRLRTPTEVIDAFEDHGIELARVRLPPVLSDGAPVYRDAVLHQHSATSANAFVLVCKTRCSMPQQELEGTRGGIPDGQHLLLGVIPGNNVVVWVTAEGRRSAGKLSRRTSPAVRDISGQIDPDSRCYIN